MINSIDGLIERARLGGTQKIAVACAHDHEVLLSLKKAVQKKIVSPILVGNKREIKSMLEGYAYNFEAEIIHSSNEEEAAEISVKLISSGKADTLMKGLIPTPTLLKAVLNKEWGLRSGKLLSHVALFIPEKYRRMFFLTDAAMNIAPDLMQKKMILENAVKIAHKLGINTPKVVPICAIETVNPNMPATVDAALLSKMNERGQIKGCLVDGPFSLDNAISEEAARHKQINSPIAGKADILLAPTIEVGNALYKSLSYFSDCNFAGCIAGAKAPIIVTSRSDSAETKFNSIVLATALSQKNS